MAVCRGAQDIRVSSNHLQQTGSWKYLRESHFPVQVRFNVSMPSCVRSTAECERLIHLPAQQQQRLIYGCVSCLSSSALQPFILPDADDLLRGAKTLHLSMGAWHLAESDQHLVGFDPRVLKNKGYLSSCIQRQLTQSWCPWKSHCDLWCEQFRGGDITQVCWICSLAAGTKIHCE